MSTRRRIATVVAIVGVFVVGRTLFEAWPRETSITYDVGPQVTELDVDILVEGEAISSVRFQRPEQSTRVFAHAPELQRGSYELQITVRSSDGPAMAEVRSLQVPTAGPTRIDLRGLTP